jgi:hypothetical protein
MEAKAASASFVMEPSATSGSISGENVPDSQLSSGFINPNRQAFNGPNVISVSAARISLAMPILTNIFSTREASITNA